MLSRHLKFKSIRLVMNKKVSDFKYPYGITTNRYYDKQFHSTTSVGTLPDTLTVKNFKLADYDCIGFDLDNTVARYKIGAMMQMEYEILADHMVERGYSKKHLLQPVEQDFLLKGLIIDNDNGNILKIAADGKILLASHGTRILNDEQIQKYYPNFHWKPTDIFAENPLLTWNGPYSEKMRTLLDYFDIVASLVYARTVDSIDEANGKPSDNYNIWPELLEALQKMFNRDHFQENKGIYFDRMKSSPEKYYYKASDDLINWFKYLKEKKKLLFLITGAYVDFASLTASSSLGADWKNYFDIIVTYAKKPGFFTQDRNFVGLNNFRETTPVPLELLKIGGTYTHGNWKDLHQFLSKCSNKNDPKFVYIGDNLIQDIYTPSVHTECDTVAVCEEMQAEGLHGHDAQHPDKLFLKSTTWGSYFQYKKYDTNWFQILKKHSKFCIPSLEYLARFPLEYEHRYLF